MEAKENLKKKEVRNKTTHRKCSAEMETGFASVAIKASGGLGD